MALQQSDLSPETLAQRLLEANGLVQSLSEDLNAARVEITGLRAEAAVSKTALENLAKQRDDLTAKVESLPQLAESKAKAILAGIGTAPVRESAPNQIGDPVAIRAQFAAMRPGSPEATEFFARHRKVLSGTR